MARAIAFLAASLITLVLGAPAAAEGLVEQFAPQGEAKQVRQVTARFSQPMVPFGDPRQLDPFDIDCPGPGSGRWVDTRNWAYDFDDDLPAGLTCRFVLRKGLSSLAGDPLAPGQTFTFSTGGPSILQSIPYDGDQAIDENQAVLVALDAPARHASVVRGAYCAVEGIAERIPVRVIDGESRLRILDIHKHFVEDYARSGPAARTGAWSTVSAPGTAGERRRVQWLRDSPDSPLMVLRCERTLPAAAKVRLVWGQGIESATGVASSQEQALEFKVRPPFQASFDCERVNRKADCIPLLPMHLRFTAPVAFLDAAKIRLVGADGRVYKPSLGRGEALEGSVESLSFPGPFPPHASFRLELPPELKDDAGRTLANAGRFPLPVRTEDYPPLAKFAASFGIIERGPGAAIPVTLRNLEPEIRVRLARTGPGRSGEESRVPGKLHRSREDAEILDWLRRLRRASESHSRWDAEQGREVVQHRAGASSVFGPKDRTDGFTLALSRKGKAFEVVGIPLGGPGLYVAEIASPRLGAALLGERRPFFAQGAALVTNLAVHLKLGRESSLVWVTSLDSAMPVPNAEVTVRDCGGKVHYRGRTDAQGIVRIDGALPRRQGLPVCLGSHDRQYFVTARAGEDLSFVFSDWNEGIAPWRFGMPGGSWSGPYVAHAVFDRSLLRAGETVQMKIFLRQQTASGFSVPPADRLGDKVLVRHAGSGQETEIAASWDDHGRAEASWQIPREAKQGSYEVLIRDRLVGAARGRRALDQTRPAGTFRVEAFRVPTMKAVLKGPAKPLIDADSVPIDIQLGYLAGGPAANASVRLRVHPQPKTVRFADYDQFAFANGDVRQGEEPSRPVAWSEEEGEAEDQPTEDAEPQVQAALTRSLKLDRTGAARPVVGGLPRADRPMDLAVELEYRDANGEIATSATRLGLWPAGIVVGIKPDSWVATPEKLRFQVLALDLAGRPLAGIPVATDLLLREHYSHRRRVLGGFYAYEHSTELKRLAEACQGATDDKGLLSCEMRAPRSGNLIVRAVGHDAEGRRSVAHREIWVAAGGDWWFDGGDNDRIDLLPEKKRYETGETARFQLRMPFKEATVLVTVEREGVAESFVRRVSRTKPVIEVPVKGSYAPNVYVSALVVRGRIHGIQPTALVDLGKPSLKMGLAEINVGWAARELKVRVTPERTAYKVRDKARVRIEVRRSDGRAPPPGSEVALAAVDEGLLELLPNDSWQLLEAMMKRRGLEVETSTAQMQVVGKRHYGRKALPAGGGGGRQSSRELFDTLLLWRARIVLDANGVAEAEVPLNDSITSFRIVAVADGPDDLFGSGAATIRSSQDLILVSGLPALVRDGDRLHAKFTVRNAAEKALDVKVSAAMSASPGGAAPGQAMHLPSRSLRLPPGEAGEVGWEVSVPAQARRLDWEVKAGGGEGLPTDAIRVSQRVEPAVPVRAFQATLAQLDRPLQMAIKVPAGALPGSGGVRLDFDRTLAGGLSAVRDYMASYPYTCLEQRVSRAVALGDAEEWRRLTADLPGQLDRDGLAKYFPSLSEGSDVLTAYLLSVAQAAGLVLPAAERSRMLDGLKAFVEGRIVRRTALPVADLAVRKLAAVDALARQGEPVQPQWLESFSIEPNLWPTSALLDWYDILGRAPGLPQRDERMKQVAGLLRSRLNLQGTALLFSTERGDALWWLMASADANAARLLLAVIDEPSWQPDVPRLARGLLGRQQRGHWATTVANAWGSLAIAGFSARFEKQTVEGVTVATLGGNRVEHRWSAGGDARALLPWPAGGEASLALRQEGPGRPWASVRSLAAIPLQAPLVSGFKVARTVTPMEQRVKGMWSRGDVARVRLELEAQSDMTWVALSDPVPAGGQILGTGLGGDSTLLRRGEKRRDGPWPDFEERGFDAFRAYYSFVPKGRWALEYTVRFNAAGDFRLPPSRIEALYVPEMFGESPNLALQVQP